MTSPGTEKIAQVQAMIHYYGFLVIALSMPLPFYPINNIGIIIIGVNVIAGMILQKRFTSKNSPWLWALPTLFILYVIGVSYSDNTSAAWSSVERKLPLLLLPVAAMFFPAFDRKQLENIFKAFLAACVLISMFAVFTMLKRNIDQGVAFEFYNNYYFSQDNLVAGVNFHHVYFSMYMSFCVVICLYFISSSSKVATTIIYGVTIIWSALFMLLLSGRMGIITLTIVLALYFLFMLRMKWSVKILASISAIILIVVVGYQFPFIRDKFTGVLNINVDQYSYQHRASARMVPIVLTWNIFKENWVAGVGSGDLYDLLISEYHRINFEEGIIHEYNPHDQYIDTAASVGIGGLLVLLGSMLSLYYYAIRSRDFLAIAFAVIVSFSFLTESMLSRQRGVVFLATFISVIFAHRAGTRDAILKFQSK